MSEPAGSQWYAAVAVYAVRSDAPDHAPLYNESVVILRATSEDEARSRARAWARDQEHSYVGGEGDRITWSLETIVDVTLVLDQDLTDGSEVYSRFFRDYPAYRSFDPLLDGEPL